MPGTAASGGGGAATLGYDDQVRITPLTVGFHETQFLSTIGEENREIAAKGFWFQRSEREQAQSKYQWGPTNPQALNRYTYCLGSPLRYVDLTGHHERITIYRESWGPLSREEAAGINNSRSDFLDLMLYGLGLMLSRFGPPGWLLTGFDVAAIFAIDNIPLEAGDHGFLNISYDPDEGKFIWIEFIIDEDGHILSYTQMHSWDGTSWWLVAHTEDWTPDDEEDQ